MRRTNVLQRKTERECYLSWPLCVKYYFTLKQALYDYLL